MDVKASPATYRLCGLGQATGPLQAPDLTFSLLGPLRRLQQGVCAKRPAPPGKWALHAQAHADPLLSLPPRALNLAQARPHLVHDPHMRQGPRLWETCTPPTLCVSVGPLACRTPRESQVFSCTTAPLRPHGLSHTHTRAGASCAYVDGHMGHSHAHMHTYARAQRDTWLQVCPCTSSPARSHTQRRPSQARPGPKVAVFTAEECKQLGMLCQRT